ncbi:MAG: VanZ family protein [Gammaproteobacteria bacterium]|nr:VanZ family protein [Gammaproteobacteria bacterium]MBU1557045.1 VanZ family protein [Gammaproteobacteria bacterium]MBU2069837.1 VanZ family protein [Gammaproteobacteria bacterium]MBU2184881.1 VanZ family protein [Gammaproteobacteria bacterium]MBU2204417.1 VanZ family protein [Gammaproteobacteria bacterium]
MPQSFYRWLCVFCFTAATASFLAELSGHRIAGGMAHIDKLAHFAIFAVLSALLWKGFKLRPLPAVILLGSYGGAIELAQHFFTRRNGDWWDLLADITGIASFYLLRALWHALRPRSQR